MSVNEKTVIAGILDGQDSSPYNGEVVPVKVERTVLDRLPWRERWRARLSLFFETDECITLPRLVLKIHCSRPKSANWFKTIGAPFGFSQFVSDQRVDVHVQLPPSYPFYPTANYIGAIEIVWDHCPAKSGGQIDWGLFGNASDGPLAVGKIIFRLE